MTADLPQLDDLLRRASAEIRRCRGIVLRLEDAVHSLFDAHALQGPMQDFQSIDLLDQRLHDLALWSEALAAAVAGQCASRSAGTLAAGLLLHEMRDALGGAAAGGNKATENITGPGTGGGRIGPPAEDPASPAPAVAVDRTEVF